jgi:hypothetical protein
MELAEIRDQPLEPPHRGAKMTLLVDCTAFSESPPIILAKVASRNGSNASFS